MHPGRIMTVALTWLLGSLATCDSKSGTASSSSVQATVVNTQTSTAPTRSTSSSASPSSAPTTVTTLAQCTMVDAFTNDTQPPQVNPSSLADVTIVAFSVSVWPEGAGVSVGAQGASRLTPELTAAFEREKVKLGGTLPAALPQPCCTGGAILDVVLADGQRATYGPCARPVVLDQIINALFAAQTADLRPQSGSRRRAMSGTLGACQDLGNQSAASIVRQPCASLQPRSSRLPASRDARRIMNDRMRPLRPPSTSRTVPTRRT